MPEDRKINNSVVIIASVGTAMWQSSETYSLHLPFPLSLMSFLHPPMLACLQPFRQVLWILAEMLTVIRLNIAVNFCEEI